MSARLCQNIPASIGDQASLRFRPAWPASFCVIAYFGDILSRSLSITTLLVFEVELSSLSLTLTRTAEMYFSFAMYEGWSKITEPYLITFESSKMDINLDDISL